MQPRRMGLREYSRHRGCSLRAVQKAIASGRITVQGGSIDPDRADAEWAANTDLSRHSNTVTGIGGKRNGHAIELPPHQVELWNAKTAHAITRAHLLELELQERRRELVPVAAVEAWLKSRDRRIRELLESIPDRLATRLTAEQRRALADRIGRVCDELARVAAGDAAPSPK